MLAWGTRLPCGSVTIPVMAVRSTWALKLNGGRQRDNNMMNVERKASFIGSGVFRIFPARGGLRVYQALQQFCNLRCGNQKATAFTMDRRFPSNHEGTILKPEIGRQGAVILSIRVTEDCRSSQLRNVHRFLITSFLEIPLTTEPRQASNRT